MVNLITIFKNNINRHLTLAEFEKELKKPHQTLRPKLDSLIKQNIIKKEGKIYSLNLKNPESLEYLSIAEKEELFFTLKDPLFFIIYQKFSKFFDKGLLIVFGSSIINIKSAADIDILIVSDKDAEYEKAAAEIEKTYNKKIHLIIANKINTALKNEVRKKHIFLNNSDEGIIFLWQAYLGAKDEEMA